MMEVFEGKHVTRLTYGLLFSKIFECYGIELSETESVMAKEFSNVKCLSQSNLKIYKDNVLVQVEYSPTVYISPHMGYLVVDPFFENRLG